MIVLTTSANAQIFNVIPRDYSLSDFTMTIRDDSTNVTVTYEITGATVEGNYVTFENIFSPILVENHFYDFTLIDTTIADDTQIIFKDRIFCTDQTINQVDGNYYNINEGQYTSDESYNNEYIVV